jgi:hypothetical protein
MIILPYIGVFVYLLRQSRGMAEGDQSRRQHAREGLRQFVGYSVADELEKLLRLKNSGARTAIALLSVSTRTLLAYVRVYRELGDDGDSAGKPRDRGSLEDEIRNRVTTLLPRRPGALRETGHPVRRAYG